MPKYAAKCERFPFLVIAVGANPLEFKEGLFVTEDESQWAVLQQNSGWGSYITETEVPGEKPPEPPVEGPPVEGPPAEGATSDEEPSFPGVRRGSRGTR